MSILVIAEHDNQQLKPATRHVIQAAQELPGSVNVVVMGHHCQAVVEEVAHCEGVETVLLADHSALVHHLAECMVPTLQALSVDFSYVLAPSSTFGKNVLPRLAAALDVAPVSDVLKIEDNCTFIRPIYAGNALATVRCLEPIKLLTLRTTAFRGCQLSPNPAPLKPISFIDPAASIPQEEAYSPRKSLSLLKHWLINSMPR